MTRKEKFLIVLWIISMAISTVCLVASAILMAHNV